MVGLRASAIGLRLEESQHLYLEKRWSGSGWRATDVFACGNLLEKHLAPASLAARGRADSSHLDGFGRVSPSPPHLRIASKHGVGSDVDCIIGDFDLCFQWLTGKILITQHLALRPEVDPAASAFPIICLSGLEHKVRCHSGVLWIVAV